MTEHPNSPIFIPSKGRAHSRLTMKALDRMGVEYRVVVEEKEYALYREHIVDERLVVLDPKYQDQYDTCDDLDDGKSKGSGPARNFIWDLSVSEGHEWHWIMDDNIRLFARFNRNLKVPCGSGAVFLAMEEFCLRYTNVAMAGPNYWMFIPRKRTKQPFTLNTRIYSCNLIRNDVPYRWRGRFNEDTDLSLRMLKDGWCTILFNAFIQDKMTTQSMAGGNTEALYAEGTVRKSNMIVRLHPDIAKLTRRFGRCHHLVDYRSFKANKLRRRRGLEIADGTNNFGMELRMRDT